MSYIPGAYENRLRARMQRITTSVDAAEKAAPMLAALFDPNDRAVTSLRECYITLTGDREVTGRVDCSDPTRLRALLRNQEADGRLREAIDSSAWANVLGAALGRQLVREYSDARLARFTVWRDLATVVPVDSFRTQERVRWGGYGELPVVFEGGAYAALTTPPTEAATYSVTKRGGLESVTLEMVQNDDVNALRLIPQLLAEAAARTLGHFVLDFLRLNLPIYDGQTLFHASRGNLASAPLSAAAMAAAIAAMQKRTAPGNSDGDPLGIRPRVLWVPFEMEEAGYNLFVRQQQTAAQWLHRQRLDVRAVWYWNDANDWCVSADPEQCPTIEVGFLHGVEEPELFVQDLPTAGSLFSFDKLTYKIRHVYGGAALDWRGLYKSVAP